MAESTLQVLYCDDWPHFISARHCMEYLQLTEQDCTQWTPQRLHNTALLLQIRTASFCILSLNFCSFDFKKYETCTENGEKLNRLIDAIKHKVPIPPLPKPTNDEVRSEYLKKTKGGPVSTQKDCNETVRPYLTQLGLNYFPDNTCSLRTKSLKLTCKKAKSKQITCLNIADFDEWLASGGGGG